MLTGTVLSSSFFMHCSRCILSWTNTLCIIVLSSKLMRLNIFKSRMKTKVLVSNFLSLLILWFLKGFCTALAQVLSWPFPSHRALKSVWPSSLCALASLLSWFLPTPSPLPCLVLACPCFPVASDLPVLYQLNIWRRKLLVWTSVSCLCPCQWCYSCIYNLPVSISTWITSLSSSAVTNECCQGIWVAVYLTNYTACTPNFSVGTNYQFC